MISFKFENNDFVLTPRGKLQQNFGTEIIVQSINKIIRTSQESIANSNIPFRYNPKFGTNTPFIQALTGALSEDAIISELRNDLNNTILYADKLQRTKLRYGLAPGSLFTDADVNVYPYMVDTGVNGQKQKVMKYDLEVKAKDGKIETFSGTAGSF
jgi:type IV secretory pathway TrbF-like protein